MLQTTFLQRYAPSSLILLYRPQDTGSPGHDISEHISRFSAHRIDFEETQLVGVVIGHIELMILAQPTKPRCKAASAL